MLTRVVAREGRDIGADSGLDVCDVMGVSGNGGVDGGTRKMRRARC